MSALSPFNPEQRTSWVTVAKTVRCQGSTFHCPYSITSLKKKITQGDVAEIV